MPFLGDGPTRSPRKEANRKPSDANDPAPEPQDLAIDLGVLRKRLAQVAYYGSGRSGEPLWIEQQGGHLRLSLRREGRRWSVLAPVSGGSRGGPRLSIRTDLEGLLNQVRRASTWTADAQATLRWEEGCLRIETPDRESIEVPAVDETLPPDPGFEAEGRIEVDVHPARLRAIADTVGPNGYVLFDPRNARVVGVEPCGSTAMLDGRVKRKLEIQDLRHGTAVWLSAPEAGRLADAVDQLWTERKEALKGARSGGSRAREKRYKAARPSIRLSAERYLDTLDAVDGRLDGRSRIEIPGFIEFVGEARGPGLEEERRATHTPSPAWDAVRGQVTAGSLRDIAREAVSAGLAAERGTAQGHAPTVTFSGSSGTVKVLTAAPDADRLIPRPGLEGDGVVTIPAAQLLRALDQIPIRTKLDVSVEAGTVRITAQDGLHLALTPLAPTPSPHALAQRTADQAREIEGLIEGEEDRVGRDGRRPQLPPYLPAHRHRDLWALSEQERAADRRDAGYWRDLDPDDRERMYREMTQAIQNPEMDARDREEIFEHLWGLCYRFMVHRARKHPRGRLLPLSEKVAYAQLAFVKVVQKTKIDPKRGSFFSVLGTAIDREINRAPVPGPAHIPESFQADPVNRALRGRKTNDPERIREEYPEILGEWTDEEIHERVRVLQQAHALSMAAPLAGQWAKQLPAEGAAEEHAPDPRTARAILSALPGYARGPLRHEAGVDGLIELQPLELANAVGRSDVGMRRPLEELRASTQQSIEFRRRPDARYTAGERTDPPKTRMLT